MVNHTSSLITETIRDYITLPYENIEVLATTPSTQTEAKQAIPCELPHFYIAEEQTQGQGQYQRYWHSPKGENVYLSCLYPLNRPLNQCQGLSLWLSMVIARLLRQKFALDEKLQLKWPNDVLYEGKKLAGILIEFEYDQAQQPYAIIGIGLNVNLLQTQQINKPWISLQQILAQPVERNGLTGALIQALLQHMLIFSGGAPLDLPRQWQCFDYLYNKAIRVVTNNRSYQGLAQGITPEGYLKLKSAQGTIKEFISGSIQLLK
jgi:BirA family biotin operon repressor/biotin-[acetyl-CoA-carboxylase] ligase